MHICICMFCQGLSTAVRTQVNCLGKAASGQLKLKQLVFDFDGAIYKCFRVYNSRRSFYCVGEKNCGVKRL